MKHHRRDTASLPVRGPGLFGERAVNESAYSNEAQMEHGPGTTCDSHLSRPEYFERNERGVVQGPQIIEAIAPECVLSCEASLISFAPELGDRPAMASSSHRFSVRTS